MIRHSTLSDLQSILEIYNEAVVNTTAVYDYEPFTYENRKEWYEAKVEAGYPVIVYEEDNQVIGFATYGPFRPRPAYQYTVEHSVYVNERYGGKGIGSQLLKRIIELAEDADYKMMVGVIDAANEGSIKLHTKNGFEYAGTIKKAGYKFGKWLDLAFYQLELTGPSNPVEK